MKEQYVKVEEFDGIELWLMPKVITGCCVCRYGHFMDVNTGENLGQKCVGYTLYYDKQYNRLKEPKIENIIWVED